MGKVEGIKKMKNIWIKIKEKFNKILDIAISKEENTSHSFSRGGNTDQIDIRDNDMII